MIRTRVYVFMVSILVASASSAYSQLLLLTRDEMIKCTAKNPFDRFQDGRPKIPDAILEKMKDLSAEEVWGTLQSAKYLNQFEGQFQVLHPERKLIGRAVTAQFMPLRPDLVEVIDSNAKSRGMTQNHNQRVIDLLQPGDVLVVDLFGKIEGGTLIGDNLATAIFASSKTGFVVDGAIRDLEGIYPIPMAGYFRGSHPVPLGNVMITGINIPIRIGNATVMPGDAVLGDREGVSFIPPHLVQEVVNKADEIHIHDEWTKSKLMTGKYKSSEIYGTLSEELKKEYEEYKRKRMTQR